MDIVEIENGLMQLYPDFAKNISQFPIGARGRARVQPGLQSLGVAFLLVKWLVSEICRVFWWR